MTRKTPRRRSIVPDPLRWPTCVRCDLAYPKSLRWPEGPICPYCFDEARWHEGVCSDCGHQGVLPGWRSAQERLCSECCDVPISVRCRQCGREAQMRRSTVCQRCRLTNRVYELLGGPERAIHPDLMPLADAIIAMPRADSGYTWIGANPMVRDTLRSLGSGEIDLTHEELDTLPASRTVEYIRGLLVACGSLPERDENLAKFERWFEAKRTQVSHPEHAFVLECYVRWHLLRIMRAKAGNGPVPDGSFLRSKQYVTVAIEFLNWLEDRDRSLEQCSQHDVDDWFAGGTTTRRHAANLMWWAIHQRLLRNVVVPSWTARSSPALGQQERISALRTILLDEELPSPLRVIASLVLLYGQPICRIVQLSIHDLRDDRAEMKIRFADDWVDVPEPVASIFRMHIENRPNTRTAANADSDLLFPGRMPGRSLHVYRVATLLSDYGVPALAARSGTWLQLVQDGPATVIARSLGISAVTAMRFAKRAGSDYSRYVAVRLSGEIQAQLDVCH